VNFYTSRPPKADVTQTTKIGRIGRQKYVVWHEIDRLLSHNFCRMTFSIVELSRPKRLESCCLTAGTIM